MRGEEVVPGRPSHPEVEVREPVGQRPAVRATDREGGLSRPGEGVLHRHQGGEAGRRHYPGPLENADVVPDQGLVGGFEPDSVEPAVEGTEPPPGWVEVICHRSARDLAQRHQQVLAGVPAEQARLGEKRDIGWAARGQPGLQEGRDAVPSREVADRNASLPGEGAQHELEVPQLGSRPDCGDLQLLPAQAGPPSTGPPSASPHRGSRAASSQDSGQNYRRRSLGRPEPVSSVHVAAFVLPVVPQRPGRISRQPGHRLPRWLTRRSLGRAFRLVGWGP